MNADIIVAICYDTGGFEILRVTVIEFKASKALENHQRFRKRTDVCRLSASRVSPSPPKARQAIEDPQFQVLFTLGDACFPHSSARVMALSHRERSYASESEPESSVCSNQAEQATRGDVVADSEEPESNPWSNEQQRLRSDHLSDSEEPPFQPEASTSQQHQPEPEPDEMTLEAWATFADEYYESKSYKSLRILLKA